MWWWLVACGAPPEMSSDTAPPAAWDSAASPVDTAPSAVTLPPTESTPASPTWDAHVEGLVYLRCGGCHMGGEDSGGMNLDAGRRAVVDVPSVDVPAMDLVEPGDPDASYLWHKVNGTHRAVGGAGAQMPTQFTLKAPELALLERWILQGAP